MFSPNPVNLPMSWLARLLALTAAPALVWLAAPKKPLPAKAAWTVMIYQDIDNELETPGIENLKEMMRVGGSEKVNMIVLCDRSAESEPKELYSNSAVSTVPDWSGARMLQLQGGRLIQVDNWGKTNMADPQTLARFVEVSTKAYPADRYALVISDHGSGWAEFCVDESSDGDALNLRELRSALEPWVKENKKLDFVGLDACLMGSFEVAQALAPVATTMVGSEEVAPARGWNWDAMLKLLNDKPEATPFDLGRTIIDAYTIHFNKTEDPLAQYSSLGSTLSMIDLEKFAALQTAVSVLGDKCSNAMRNQQKAGWIKVARGRAKSEEYGIEGIGVEGGYEEMHDLIQLAQVLQASGDPEITQAAKDVESAAKGAITYLMRGPLRPHAGGLSIYFPTDGVDLQDPLSKEYLSQTFSREARWVNFLSLYSVAVNDFAEAPTLLPVKKTGDVSTLEQPVQVIAKTTDDDIDKASFVVIAPNGPDLLMISRMPQRIQPDGVMGQHFRGLWFMLTDKTRTLTCPITTMEPLNEQRTSFIAQVPAQYRRGEAEWKDVSLTFHIQTGAAPSGKLVYAFAGTEEGPRHVALARGDKLRPVYSKISQEGLVGRWVSDKPNAYVEIDDPATFGLAWGQIGKNLYKVGFEIVNLAGMTDIDFTDVRLQ